MQRRYLSYILKSRQIKHLREIITIWVFGKIVGLNSPILSGVVEYKFGCLRNNWVATTQLDVWEAKHS